MVQESPLVDITVSESHPSDHDGATSPMKVSHRSGGMEPVFRRDNSAQAVQLRRVLP
jgi:hypothetical protein